MGNLGPAKNEYHTLSVLILEAKEFQEMAWSGSGVSWNLALVMRGETFRKGSKLESPTFGALGVPDLKLWFFPKGDSKAPEDKCSGFLVAPAGWRLKFKLSVDGKDSAPLTHVFSDDLLSFGFRSLGPAKNDYAALSLQILEAKKFKEIECSGHSVSWNLALQMRGRTFGKGDRLESPS